MPDASAAWSSAFLKQARGEWQAWTVLRGRDDVAACVQLHMLQMATEKLAKAHLLRFGTLGIEDVRTHVVFEKCIGIVLSARMRRLFPGLTGLQLKRLKVRIMGVASAVEALHPQISASGENVEYPWVRGGTVVAPVDTTFGEVRRLLAGPEGIRFLKVVEATFSELESDLAKDGT